MIIGNNKTTSKISLFLYQYFDIENIEISCSSFLECVYFGLLYPSLIFDMFIVDMLKIGKADQMTPI